MNIFTKKKTTIIQFDPYQFGQLLEFFSTIILNQNKIIMTQVELTAQISAFSVKLSKAIEEIKAAVANQSNVTPELQAAVDNLGTLVQAADDLNPDGQ